MHVVRPLALEPRSYILLKWCTETKIWLGTMQHGSQNICMIWEDWIFFEDATNTEKLAYCHMWMQYLFFWRTSVSIEHGNHVAGKLAKEVQLPAHPPTHPKKPKHQCLRRPCYLSVMNSQARRKEVADIDIRGLTDTGRALPRAQQLPTKIGYACVWDSRISIFSNLPKRLSPRGPRGTLRHSAVTEKRGMSEILTSSGHIFSDDT